MRLYALRCERKGKKSRLGLGRPPSGGFFSEIQAKVVILGEESGVKLWERGREMLLPVRLVSTSISTLSKR